jgi:hypothetical protein
LYGYGGFGGVDIEETDGFGDDGEKLHLPLGILYSGTTLNKILTLSNMGDLPSFAKIMIIPKGMTKLIPLFSLSLCIIIFI